MDEVELLHIVTQGAYVCGDAYGALGLINVIKNKAGVTLFATGFVPNEKGPGGRWETEFKDVGLEAHQRLAEKLVRQEGAVVTNRKAGDHPLDYQMIYFLNGNPLGKRSASGLSLSWERPVPLNPRRSTRK